MSHSKRLARLIADAPPPPYETAESPAKGFAVSGRERRTLSALEQAWGRLIHETALWSSMVTLTFLRESSKGFRITQFAIERALRRLVRLVNHDLFGKRLTNKGRTLAHAVVVDYGLLGDHPHAHLLLAAPHGVTEEELCRVVERAARRTRIIARERHYRRYYSAGGAEYLIGHGTDRMVVPLLSPERRAG